MFKGVYAKATNQLTAFMLKKYRNKCNQKNNPHLSAARRCLGFPLYDGVLAALHVHVLHVISGVHRRISLWFHDYWNWPQWGVLGSLNLPGSMLLIKIKK